jgi:hypothetical protein
MRLPSSHLALLNDPRVVVRVMPLIARLENWPPLPLSEVAERVRRSAAGVVVTM